MKIDGRKLVILKILKENLTPLSLSEFLSKLGAGYNERTVRRWLSQLIEEGLVKKTGLTKNAKYQAIEENNALKKTTDSCFSSKSLEIINKINRPIFERYPIAYNDAWIDSYTPNHTFYLPEKIRKQLFSIGNRMNSENPAGTYAHQIFNRLLIDLSYNSSRLEGNTYSLLDTERLLIHGNSAVGKLDEEKIMILNHKEAIRYLVDNAPRIKISLETICTLHYLLSSDLIDNQNCGKVRNHGVRILGSTYIPFENPQQLEFFLKEIAMKASAIVDPFEQSFFLLVHISYLQAFIDVNKRTARLSANISLISKNLVPLSFIGIEKSDYASAMIAIYELQEVQPLIDLFIFSYTRTCTAYDATVKSMEFDEVRVLYREQRRNLIRQVIQKNLKGKNLEYYIEENSSIIAEKDRKAFIEDTKEDLKQLDAIRIAGLGITLEELQNWKNLPT